MAKASKITEFYAEGQNYDKPISNHRNIIVTE